MKIVEVNLTHLWQQLPAQTRPAENSQTCFSLFSVTLLKEIKKTVGPRRSSRCEAPVLCCRWVYRRIWRCCADGGRAGCYRWITLRAAASLSIKGFSPSSDWTTLLSIIITGLRLLPWTRALTVNLSSTRQKKLLHSKKLFLDDCLHTEWTRNHINTSRHIQKDVVCVAQQKKWD